MHNVTFLPNCSFSVVRSKFNPPGLLYGQPTGLSLGNSLTGLKSITSFSFLHPSFTPLSSPILFPFLNEVYPFSCSVFQKFHQIFLVFLLPSGRVPEWSTRSWVGLFWDLFEISSLVFHLVLSFPIVSPTPKTILPPLKLVFRRLNRRSLSVTPY